MTDEPRNAIDRFAKAMYRVLDGPVTWVRKSIVEPNQKSYPYYHEKFRRVPTIDQCYTDDLVCVFEADQQFKRDKKVDDEILNILRMRVEDCSIYERPDHNEKCKPLYDTYNEAATNWFIKYGDLGAYSTARRAYMKQKHRMIWERRHGPVGSGMKEEIVN